MRIYLYVLALVLVISIALFTTLPSKTNAIAFTPFGGMVLYTQVCTCSANILVYVGQPRGGNFILAPSTMMYSNYRVMSGRWVLGIASGYGTCLMYSGNSCYQAGAGPIMSKVGTN